MILLLLALAAGLSAQDWPRFRGPNGSGVGQAAGLPDTFGPDQNVAWKTVVPFGRSSPVVFGGRLYLTASEGDQLLTLAYDAATGKQLWRRELKRARTHQMYKENDTASPTPAADDAGVYAFFTDFGLVSYSHDGKERWRLPLGPFKNFYGMAASPVLTKDAVLLLCDQGKQSFLLAVDRNTGKQRWRTERPGNPEGWGTPILHEDQILAVGSTRVDSYYLATGESRWSIPLVSNGSMGSPVVFRNSLIVTADASAEPYLPAFDALAKLDLDKDGRISPDECKKEEWFEHFGWADTNADGFLTAAEWNTVRQYGVGEGGAVSIPLNGKGRMEQSAIQWRFSKNTPYVPSPVLYNGVFFMVKDGGIVTSVNPVDGTMLKQGRANMSPSPYFASPVAADGKVFLSASDGKITVLRAAAEWEPLAVNDLKEDIYATPALSGSRLFVRTRGTLYAFGK